MIGMRHLDRLALNRDIREQYLRRVLVMIHRYVALLDRLALNRDIKQRQ